MSVGWQGICGVIEFKGVHFPKSVILHAVFFYLRYAVSYRDLEEILAERGVTVDHATLNRWVVKFAPQIAVRAQAKKQPTASSWRMDETYLKVKGRCGSHDPQGSNPCQWCQRFRDLCGAGSISVSAGQPDSAKCKACDTTISVGLPRQRKAPDFSWRHVKQCRWSACCSTIPAQMS